MNIDMLMLDWRSVSRPCVQSFTPTYFKARLAGRSGLTVDLVTCDGAGIGKSPWKVRCKGGGSGTGRDACHPVCNEVAETLAALEQVLVRPRYENAQG